MAGPIRRPGLFLWPQSGAASGFTGGEMRYPNLRYSLDLARLKHWELARRLKLSESGLSRRLVGRRDFTAEERALVVQVLASLGLAVDASWLFAEPVVPRARQVRVPSAEGVDGRTRTRTLLSATIGRRNTAARNLRGHCGREVRRRGDRAEHCDRCTRGRRGNSRKADGHDAARKQQRNARRTGGPAVARRVADRGGEKACRVS